MTTVMPIRFTDDIPAMRAFLESLGLQPRISSNRPGWVEMAGVAGLVGLHAARDATNDGPGDTVLSFEVDDADVAAAALGDAGFGASVIDEAWSRVVEVTDPDGRTLLCEERPRDLYGYTAHAVDPHRAGARVVPVVTTSDPMAYAALLCALGVAPDEVELRAGAEPGVGLAFVLVDPDGQPVTVRDR